MYISKYPVSIYPSQNVYGKNHLLRFPTIGVEEAGATASKEGVKDVNEEAVNVAVKEVGTTASKEVGREVVEEAETTVSKEVDRDIDVVEEEMNVEV